MNVLPSAMIEQLPPGPQRAPAEVTPVRALQNPGERLGTPRREPQASSEQRDEVMDRLRRASEREDGLPLRGRRAVAAYTSLDRADEQAYMRQVLGFEVQI
jgi:hypothetical protein